MVFKPIVGLGHTTSSISDGLGLKFFEFAIGFKEQRESLDEKLEKGQLGQNIEVAEPWLEQFRTPPFYGDFLNQQVFPAEKVQMIPAAFRVPLPTKDIADAWNK